MLAHMEQIRRATHIQHVTDWLLNTDYFVPCEIDEVSLLFETEGKLDDFIRGAKQDCNAEHFNSVIDHMVMQYSARDNEMEGYNSFDVRFEFLRIPHCDWRIEAMTVLRGYAPLHSQHLQHLGNGCVMHASYKPESYQKERRNLDELMDFRAEYRNSYGVFAYYNFGLWYVKPRRNTRDIQ